MEDEELLAGVPDDVVADSTEDMLASSTAVPDATPTADADQMAVEGDPPAAGSTEGGDNGKGSTRFSGKRKIIEHTLPADAMMGVDVNSPEECVKRQARASKFGLPESSPLAMADVAAPSKAPKYISIEEVEARQARAQKFGIGSKTDPLEWVEASAGKGAFWEKRRNASEDEMPRAEAVHIFGTDRCSTADVLGYFRGDAVEPRCIEWVNDSSANVVFPDGDACAAALEARTVALVPDELAISHLVWRTVPFEGINAGKGLQLVFRIATDKDVKPPKRAPSRWYGEAHGKKKGARGRGDKNKPRLQPPQAVPGTLSSTIAAGRYFGAMGEEKSVEEEAPTLASLANKGSASQLIAKRQMGSSLRERLGLPGKGGEGDRRGANDNANDVRSTFSYEAAKMELEGKTWGGGATPWHRFRENNRCKSRCKIASDWFSKTKKICCQRQAVLVETTLAGGAELLRRWGRCLEARVAALPSASSASAQQPSSRSSSSARALYPGAAAE